MTPRRVIVCCTQLSPSHEKKKKLVKTLQQTTTQKETTVRAKRPQFSTLFKKKILQEKKRQIPKKNTVHLHRVALTDTVSRLGHGMLRYNWYNWCVRRSRLCFGSRANLAGLLCVSEAARLGRRRFCCRGPLCERLLIYVF